MKIERIKLTSMRHELHYEFHKNVLFIVNKLTGEQMSVLDIVVLLAPYLKAFETEKLVLDIVVKSRFSRAIAEADHKRGQSYAGFVSAVKTMFHHHDHEVRQAAERVMGIFKHYRDVPKRRYDEESAAIEDLLRELEREDLAADIVMLQVAEWRDRLKADNNAFEALTHQRYEEKAALPSVRMNEARVETDKHYNNIVMHLEYGHMRGWESPELIALTTELNVLIKHYREVMTRKHKTVISD